MSIVSTIGDNLFWIHPYRGQQAISLSQTIKQAAMAGLGVTFISAHTIEQEAELGCLILLNVVGLPGNQ